MSSHLEELKTAGYNGDILLKPTGIQEEDDVWNLATRTWGCQSKRDPAFALKPRTVEDVSKAVQWLGRHNIDFAVRSGGTGQSQSDEAILDMGHFDKFEYDDKKGTITLGPGQTWRRVYDNLVPTPVTVLGGRVGYVGVGGFLTGGGLSFLTNAHGAATNTVLDYQIVLASGEAVWASSDADLAQAIRGAGFSFGVVTEIIMKAIPKPPAVYAGYLLYTVDKLSALAKHVEAFTLKNDDPRLSLILALFYAPGLGRICCLSPFVSVDDEEDLAAFVKRPDVFGWAWNYNPIHDGSGVMSYEGAAFSNESNVLRPLSNRSWQIGGAMLSSLNSSVLQVGADWVTELQSRPDGERFNGAGVFFMPCMKGCFVTTPATKGVWPPTGCDTLCAISIIIDQPDTLPGQAEENAAYMRDGVRRIQEAAKESGVGVVKNYPNYLIAGSPPEEFYEPETLQFLRGLKRRYDPTDMFNKGIHIGL